MDRQAGEILQKLHDDGLADETLVVFWSDHGQGMPRGKRWIYDSGTHVPVIMRWPGKLKPGSVREDIVSILDLTPTMLAVADIQPPEYMHGRVLIGSQTQPEPDFIFFTATGWMKLTSYKEALGTGGIDTSGTLSRKRPTRKASITWTKCQR